jgi:hypothetical protein
MEGLRGRKVCLRGLECSLSTRFACPWLLVEPLAGAVPVEGQRVARKHNKAFLGRVETQVMRQGIRL